MSASRICNLLPRTLGLPLGCPKPGKKRRKQHLIVTIEANFAGFVFNRQRD